MMVLGRAKDCVRVKDERLARRIASRDGKSWGVCVFTGGLFVGPKDELVKIGVVIKG